MHVLRVGTRCKVESGGALTHSTRGAQCEHHMLPFYGVAHVACVAGPSGYALQLAEVEALVAMYSKRLQVQVRALGPGPLL